MSAVQAASGRRRTSSGMTLIEVILAVTILGLCLGGLLAAATKCLAVMKMAAIHQQVQWARALGDLEHAILDVEDWRDLEVDGVEYGEGMVYSREVEPHKDADGVAYEDDLYLVKTTVSWTEGTREGAEEVVRLVWLPEKK
ncbi:MAG: prepilin-type N-terminal cleavage/methylation domain-containing protein [Lentisphaerae bacterium]|nr:prepilin-type N-terminal cleavage/methylation domain-containing protein [Lentisphaerota bacterium]